MKPSVVKGDIVQLMPSCKNGAFKYCLMVVQEVKGWGINGYIQAVGMNREVCGGQYFYRAEWSEFATTGGKAQWIIESEEDN